MLLYLPETYAFFDLTTEAGRVELGLEDGEGRRTVTELSDTWSRGLHEFGWATLNPFIPDGLTTVHDLLGRTPPFYLRRLEDNFWHTFLDQGRTVMYLQINKQAEEEGGPESMDLFLEWVQALWRTPTVEILIVDVRNDPGGNIFIGDAVTGVIPDLYVSHPAMRGVAVLLGPDTVSADTVIAAQLERRVEPILIGGPSGSAPNMFLHARKFLLPHSRIEFEVSTDEYFTTREADTRRYIAPDVPLALTFEDYLEGRDPLIEFARSIDEALARKVYGGVRSLSPWMRESQREAMK